MLTFEEKLSIIESFPELERKNVSLKRVNFHFEESRLDKKNVVYHLHPNGNGFVYASGIKGYKTDDKGMVNIREFSADELRSVLKSRGLTRTGSKRLLFDRLVDYLENIDKYKERLQKSKKSRAWEKKKT